MLCATPDSESTRSAVARGARDACLEQQPGASILYQFHVPSTQDVTGAHSQAIAFMSESDSASDAEGSTQMSIERSHSHTSRVAGWNTDCSRIPNATPRDSSAELSGPDPTIANFSFGCRWRIHSNARSRVNRSFRAERANDPDDDGRVAQGCRRCAPSKPRNGSTSIPL